MMSALDHLLGLHEAHRVLGTQQQQERTASSESGTRQRDRQGRKRPRCPGAADQDDMPTPETPEDSLHPPAVPPQGTAAGLPGAAAGAAMAGHMGPAPVWQAPPQQQAAGAGLAQLATAAGLGLPCGLPLQQQGHGLGQAPAPHAPVGAPPATIILPAPACLPAQPQGAQAAPSPAQQRAAHALHEPSLPLNEDSTSGPPDTSLQAAAWSHQQQQQQQQQLAAQLAHRLLLTQQLLQAQQAAGLHVAALQADAAQQQRQHRLAGRTTFQTSLQVPLPRLDPAAAVLAAQVWAREDARRMLHIRLQVTDISQVQLFLEHHLKMKTLRRITHPGLAFQTVMGYGSEGSHFCLALDYQEGCKPTIGASFGHLGVSLPDISISSMIENISSTGEGHVGRLQDYQGQMDPFLCEREVDQVACVLDPSGFLWEVLERRRLRIEALLCKVLLFVCGDAQPIIDFYTLVMGMRLMKHSPRKHRMQEIYRFSYGHSELETPFVELMMASPALVQDKGTGHIYTAVSTKDVHASAGIIRQLGQPLLQDVGCLQGTNITGLVTADPCGHRWALVDALQFEQAICTHAASGQQ